jgi:hypothetical protein
MESRDICQSFDTACRKKKLPTRDRALAALTCEENCEQDDNDPGREDDIQDHASANPEQEGRLEEQADVVVDERLLLGGVLQHEVVEEGRDGTARDHGCTQGRGARQSAHVLNLLPSKSEVGSQKLSDLYRSNADSQELRGSEQMYYSGRK